MAELVVVLGGGSTGSSIFYHLTLSGFKAVLVERKCVGCGQTGYSSAIIRTQYSHDETRKMAVYSWKFIRERFVDETGCQSPVFHETGVAYGITEDQADEAIRVAESLRDEGVEIEIYNPIDFSEEIHYIDTSGLKIVTWEPHGGYGEPHSLVTCFTKAAERNGGKIIIDEVVGLDISDDAVRGVKLKKEGSLKADLIINALNVWSNMLLSKHSLDLPIAPAREDVVVFYHPGTPSGPVWADLALGFYSRREGPESTLVGGLEPEFTGIESSLEPGIYDPIPHEVVISRGIASKRFPYIENSTPRAAWYGYYDVTPDWMPILGEDPRIEGLIHAVGLSGHGFKLSPALGAVIADIVKSGYTRLVDIEVYSLDRFNKGGIKRGFKYKILG